MNEECEPLVSVIVPNFNNSEYLCDCIDSILSQTYKSIEVVIADDCSTDGSQEIIKRYESKCSKVKGIYQPVNKGVTQNRIDAIDKARGVYITTMDSDDYYYCVDKIEKEKLLIDEYAANGSEIVAFSNSALVKPDGTLIGFRGDENNLRQGNLLNCIITRSCKIPYNFLITKKQFYNAGGYDPRIALYEDWDFKIRLAAQYEFHYTNKVGNAIRLHGQGLSSTSLLRHVFWLQKIFWKNFRLIQSGERKRAVKIMYHNLYMIIKNQIRAKIKKVRKWSWGSYV